MILIWTTILLLMISSFCNGHGYLKEPPSRSSMWRYGFNTPTNYNDNQLFCGGFDVQWNHNGGKCGICGDRWDGSRDNEAGGKYATGIISRHYTEGQTIHVEVKLTKQHGGYFEFRICPNNNPSRRATQACLNRYLLRQPGGSTRYFPKGGSQTYSVQLMLPPGLTCTQCVVQWIWNTASNWGCEGGQCGRGFGHQEQFRGCADVSITASGSQSYNNLAYPNNNQNQGMQNAYRPVSYIPAGNGNSNTQNYGNQISNQNSILHILSGQTSGYGNNVPMCKATDQYRAQFPYADQFCIDQCKAGRCLSEYFCTSGCKNLNTQISICEATPSFKARYPYATQYCNTICKSGNCPMQYCTPACRICMLLCANIVPKCKPYNHIYIILNFK